MKSKVAYFGVFISLALIFSYVESLIPINFGIPGVKLGLANLITILVLYKMGTKEACLVSIVRVILAGFIFGNLFSILYSLAGGLLSLAMMSFARRTDRFSIYGVSMVGGVFHNVGQLVMAMFVVESVTIAGYLPVLLVAGLVTGFVIGVVSNEMLKRLKNFSIQF